MLFCGQLILIKINFFEKKIRNTIRVSNSLEPDQASHVHLGPNNLQKLSADNKSCCWRGKSLKSDVGPMY